MSEAINELDFFAQQLAMLKDCVFPMHIVWLLPIPEGYLNVRVVEFRGAQYCDPHGFNFQGELAARNQAFLFYTTNLRGEDLGPRWTITINHWDQGVAGPGWLLDAPTQHRSGIPSGINNVMLQLVTGLVQYARDFCEYDDSAEVAKVNEFVNKLSDASKDESVETNDALASIRNRIKKRKATKSCDCSFCAKQLSVISDRID